MYKKARRNASKDEKRKESASTSLSERKRRESEQRFGAEYAEDVHAESISRYLALMWQTHGKLKEIHDFMISRIEAGGRDNRPEIEINKDKERHVLKELESCLKDIRRSLVLNSSMEHQNEEWRKQFAVTMTAYLNNPDKYEFVVDPCRSVRLDLTKWPTQSSGKKKKNKINGEDDTQKVSSPYSSVPVVPDENFKKPDPKNINDPPQESEEAEETVEDSHGEFAWNEDGNDSFDF